ncbi:hypothetical protein C8R44DRAFT_870669 [Mycena epipterygia]|nr:hypothetical protein C8R44DRAFT_870669 [Mycena epipterygia]
MNLDDLLQEMAKELGTDPVFLVTTSMEWRWIKPANSVFRPLQSEAGVTSLMNKIRDPPKNTALEIIVKMSEPVRRPPTNTPWASVPGSNSGATAFDGAYDAAFGPDDNNSDDGEEEIEKLQEMYKPGVCSLHPDVACFHNRLTNLHYELDRSKSIVWAAAIKKGTASLITAPIGSNLFNAKSVIKKKGSLPDVAAPPVIPSTPTPHASQPQFPFWPSSYPFQLPAHGYPPIHPMAYPPPFPNYQSPGIYGPPSQTSPWNDSPPRRRRRRSYDGSSPPQPSTSKQRRSDRAPDPLSSPAISGGSIENFLDQNPALPAGTQSFLEELGFQIGDDLSLITADQWKAAYIPLFASARIIKAYNKYKAILRSR